MIDRTYNAGFSPTSWLNRKLRLETLEEFKPRPLEKYEFENRRKNLNNCTFQPIMKTLLLVQKSRIFSLKTTQQRKSCPLTPWGDKSSQNWSNKSPITFTKKLILTKNIDEDLVGRIQAGSFREMTLKIDKKRLLFGRFRSFGQSI